MSIYHNIAERTHLPLKSYPNYHLSFLKTKRVNILASHLLLFMIHQIMSMPKNILNFLILVVMVSLLLHLIMMLIPSLLIYLRHWSTMIYMSMKSKPPRFPRHFSLSWWLCEVLAILRFVSLLIRKLLKHARLLITLCFAFNINPTIRLHFLH